MKMGLSLIGGYGKGRLPGILIIDDLFGRGLEGGINEERRNLCGHLLLKDIDNEQLADAPRIISPVACATFFRGQRPLTAVVGMDVENDIEGSLEVVRAGWRQTYENRLPPWSMLLLDLCFYTGRVTERSHGRTPGMPEGRPGDDDVHSYFGLTLLDAIHREFPELPIFILSSKPRGDVSLEFSRRGALGFIARDDLHGPELLQEALWQHGLLTDPSGEVVGHSLPILMALREGRRAASHRENILIRGERGTGKELLAHYVHRCSSRRPIARTKKALDESTAGEAERPFVAVNSAVFTPNLFASELFGIQPRTATGVDGKVGLIEYANHGDLFLDEISDMPREVQAAMLRVLQERQITPVGSWKAKHVDVRFLSATNIDLDDEASGFRSDLFDRLRIGGTLWLPPLRERLTDIPLLAEKFVREAEAQRKGAMQRQLSLEVLEALQSHDWPGNVRDLRSVIFDAVNRHPDVEHLVPGHLRFGTGEARKLGATTSQLAKVRSHSSVPTTTLPGELTQRNFSQLVETIARFEFDPSNRDEWAGKVGQLHSAVARLIANYVKAALLASLKPTPDNPTGDILIHPAMKLLTGERKLTASKAADLIKRYLNFSPNDRDDILKDALLWQAYDIAVRLRPTSGQKKPGKHKMNTD